MLSQQEIRSLVRMQSPQHEEQQQHLLDVSHQQLRRLNQIKLTELMVDRVDASYNYFKEFTHLNFKQINQKQQVPIKWLDISFNFFTRIDQSAQSAHIMKYLKYLNISANRIQSVDFTRLDVPLLEILNNNQLQYYLDSPPSLKVLMLNHNHLTSLAFTGGDNLNVLSATNNKIKKLGLKLKNLLLFDLQNNLIDNIESVKQLVINNNELLSINFSQNPVCLIKNYKPIILQHSNKITQIDDIIINPHIRQGFKILKQQQKLQQLLNNINSKYINRLNQKQKIKQQLIQKIKYKTQEIQTKYNHIILQQKLQFQILEQEAKNILGKNKFNIINQQKSFQQKISSYHQEKQTSSSIQSSIINNIQNQHLEQYLEYLKKQPIKPPSQNTHLNKRSSNVLDSEIRPQFRNIILFDRKGIAPLLKHYFINQPQL